MTTRKKVDLLKIRPFGTTQYEHYALTTLTAYCIYWLHEWEITTSYENIAVASHKMFPAKFALVGWPQFPDAIRTNRSLLQMRPKYRNLATSASYKGVFLNLNGMSEARLLTGKIGSPAFEDEVSSVTIPTINAERGGGKARSVHPEDLLKSVHKSELFHLFIESRFDEAEAIHLVGLLGVYDHTPSKEKKRKLKELMDAAGELDDHQTLEFLRVASERFHKYLNK